GGKASLMSLAIDECQDNIPLFSKTKNKKELISLMLSAIREYKTCNISTEQILATADILEDETLKNKLIETSLIKDAFDTLVNKSYIDPDELISIANNSLKENNVFRDYIIALDSFSGFTNAELEFLEKLMTDSREFYISLTTDNTHNNELFFTTERTNRQLINIARKNGIKISSPVVLDSPVRFRNPDLIPILRNVYRIDKETSNNKPQDIMVYESENRYSECDFVARNIRRLIIEEYYKYDDIAVVFRENNTYNGIIDTVFEKYNIPYFLDKNQDIFSKPLIKLVVSIFESINTSFNREKLINMLKSGLFSYSQEEISAFENYLYVWNISGSGLLKDFEDNPRGFVPEFTESDKKLLKKINEIRSNIITPILKFRKNSLNTTAEEITKNLYNLLLEFNITENIVLLAERFEEKGEINLSNETRRIWDILMNVLDKMINLLSNRNISLKEYSDLIMLQFNSSDIGFIPRAMDQVIVSGIERVRLTQKKAIFVLGCNEGEFPKTTSSSGIFTESERKILIEKGMEVNDSVEELNYKEMYLAYYALTLPSSKLYVSYCNSSLKGDTKTASSIIRELSEIYPKITFSSDREMTTEDKLWCKNSAFQHMANSMNVESKTQTVLIDYFNNQEDYKNKTQTLLDLKEETPAKIKDKENSEKLFGKDLHLSASQVEVYHLCKFKYFCQYGLNAKERKTAEIDSLQYGTLTHYLLERFLKEHTKDSFSSYSTDDISKIVSQYLQDYANNEIGGIDNKSKRFKYLFYRMKSNAIKLIIHIIKELSQSDYTPVAFELGVGKDIPAYNLTLDDGSILSIRGFIDRVDIMKKNDLSYVRVVDYKTGTKIFKLSDVLYGLNLQMLIYLSAVSKNGQDYFGSDLVPSGVLYQPASASFVNADREDEKDVIDSKISKGLRMNGLILDNDSVLYGMDKSDSGVFIPVYHNKRGAFTGAEYLADLVEMGKIFKNIDNLLVNMAKTLHNGEIEFNPAKDKYDACKYCPYISVCGYEEGKNCRNIVAMSKDEVLEKLNEEEE
ncbi:MAG: PD-(D/E)XK nuclease family protein, partial [Oscillospiraceae bacterium]|nr:PD-(D/E)XK nuclease family protein [Oscillospiraceae bacterium]